MVRVDERGGGDIRGFRASIIFSSETAHESVTLSVRTPLCHNGFACGLSTPKTLFEQRGGPCEDRIGTGPPRARAEVIYVDLVNRAISGSESSLCGQVGGASTRESVTLSVRTPLCQLRFCLWIGKTVVTQGGSHTQADFKRSFGGGCVQRTSNGVFEVDVRAGGGSDDCDFGDARLPCIGARRLPLHAPHPQCTPLSTMESVTSWRPETSKTNRVTITGYNWQVQPRSDANDGT
jgi:hypothetical protein